MLRLLFLPGIFLLHLSQSSRFGFGVETSLSDLSILLHVLPVFRSTLLAAAETRHAIDVRKTASQLKHVTLSSQADKRVVSCSWKLAARQRRGLRLVSIQNQNWWVLCCYIIEHTSFLLRALVHTLARAHTPLRTRLFHFWHKAQYFSLVALPFDSVHHSFLFSQPVVVGSILEENRRLSCFMPWYSWSSAVKYRLSPLCGCSQLYSSHYCVQNIWATYGLHMGSPYAAHMWPICWVFSKTTKLYVAHMLSNIW